MAERTDRYHDYEKKKITLQRPIVRVTRAADGIEREEKIEELTMREPDAGDLESIQMVPGGTMSLAVMRPLLAILTGQTEDVIKRLKGADYAAVVKTFQNFMPDGLAIGEMF